MNVQPQSSSTPAGEVERDLDSTAELPVLDISAYEAEAVTEEPAGGGTGTWIFPGPAIFESTTEPPPAIPNAATDAIAAAPATEGESKRTQLEVSLHSLSDNLREVEERLKRKGESLAEVEGAHAHVQAERAAAEQRSQQLTSELARAQAAAALAEVRLAELQRSLEEREAADGSSRTREKQLEEKLALREKALALVQQDLTTAQAVAATYLESLRSLEGRRGIFEHLCSSLYSEIDARDTRLMQAQEQLTLATSGTKDLEAAVSERVVRVTALEKQVEELTASVSQREEMLRKAAVAHDELQAELTTARTELQKRTVALQEAAAERGEHLARIAASDACVDDLQGRISEQQEFAKAIQGDYSSNVARAKELEGDLRAAEDMIHRLEAELRGRNTRVDELEKTNKQWRATVEEARNALVDRDSLIRRLEEETANSAVLLGAIQQRLEATGSQDPVADGKRRLLIRTEAESEVVHVLGRKTTVGRTSDNDLQIDAKYISRHHAVILAGPAHTIIEDLNSTNGVLVNGRRIARQTLSDGDSVMIGKTMFRFAVRPGAERRP